MEQTGLAPRTAVLPFVDRHLPLVGAIFLVLVATLRVYFVAGFDLPTALAVLAVVDRTQLLTSSVLAAMTIMLPLLIIQPGVRRWLLAGNDGDASFAVQLRTALLWIPVAPIAFATLTLPLLGGWLVASAALFAVHLFRRRKAKRLGEAPPVKIERLKQTNFTNWVVATLLGFLLYSILLQPWLVREAVTLNNGDQVVASVVGLQGEMTMLLEPGPAGVRWVDTGDIVARDLCRDPQEWHRMTLASLAPRDGVACAELLESQRH